MSGKDRRKVRGFLLKRRRASGIQAYFSTPLLCLSSCASNFISTSIFSNLLLVSQGDTIQALTRISPQIDWYCNAQGTLGKKAPASSPLPLSTLFLSNSSPSTLPPCLVFPWCLLSVTCLGDITLPFRVDRQAPPGSDGVICFEFTKRLASKMAAGSWGSDCIKSGAEWSISTHQGHWQSGPSDIVYILPVLSR